MQCSEVQYVYSAEQCSAVQCSAVQCSAVQSSTVQCSAVHYSAALCLGVGVGLTRDTSSLMVGQYFKRRRDVVEILLGTNIVQLVRSCVSDLSPQSVRPNPWTFISSP